MSTQTFQKYSLQPLPHWNTLREVHRQTARKSGTVIISFSTIMCYIINKETLRVVIAASGLVILLKSVQIVDFPARATLWNLTIEIWRKTSNNNRTHPPCTQKLCLSFYSHKWIKIGDAIKKRWNKNQIVDISIRMTLKFDGWPRKKIEHLFYTTSNFMHHFVAIRGFKLELRSGNAIIGHDFTDWKRVIRLKMGKLLSQMTLKFDGWPWKTIGHLFCAMKISDR